METKRCYKCDQILSLSCFYKDKHQPSGYRSYCKQCCNKHQKQWQKDNKDKTQSWARKSKQQRLNQGLCKYCSNPQLPNRNVCEKHYVTNIASKTLTKADNITVSKLIEKFYSHPYCPYTDEPLILGINTSLDHIKSKKNHPELTDSIDNVEWVLDQVNLCKSSLNKEEFINLCRLISSKFS